MSEAAERSRRARPHRSIPLFLGVLAVTLAAPEPAAAAEPVSANRRAAAEALFDSGLKLMKQGDFVQGCPKLEESQQMDPAVGTLLYLAECYERMGRTASAWATFREAASLARSAGQDTRARTGQERAERLEPLLSKLTIEVAEENAAIPGFEVTRGGDAVPQAVWGSSLPMDPGEVTIEARAPGYERWSTVVRVGDGAKQSVTVPALVPGPAGAAGTAEGVTAETAVPPADGARTRPPRVQRMLSFAAGGLGLVGVGVGSYYGLRAMSRNDEAETLCPESDVCTTRRGVTLTEDAKDAAAISNVAFAAGGVLIATAVVLFVTAPRETPPLRVSATLGPRAAGVGLRGEF